MPRKPSAAPWIQSAAFAAMIAIGAVVTSLESSGDYPPAIAARPALSYRQMYMPLAMKNGALVRQATEHPTSAPDPPTATVTAVAPDGDHCAGPVLTSRAAERHGREEVEGFLGLLDLELDSLHLMTFEEIRAEYGATLSDVGKTGTTCLWVATFRGTGQRYDRGRAFLDAIAGDYVSIEWWDSTQPTATATGGPTGTPGPSPTRTVTPTP